MGNHRFSGSAVSSYAKVTINVVPPPGATAPPIAFDDSVQTAEDTSLSISKALLFTNDSLPSATQLIRVVNDPPHGTAAGTCSFIGCPLGFDSITYIPDPNFHGVDAFVYEIGNLNGTSQAVVYVEVTSVVDAPALVDDDVTIPGAMSQA